MSWSKITYSSFVAEFDESYIDLCLQWHDAEDEAEANAIYESLEVLFYAEIERYLDFFIGEGGAEEFFGFFMSREEGIERFCEFASTSITRIERDDLFYAIPKIRRFVTIERKLRGQSGKRT